VVEAGSAAFSAPATGAWRIAMENPPAPLAWYCLRTQVKREHLAAASLRELEWLTKLIFQIPVKKRNDKFAQILENTGVFFEYGKEYRVTLEFDNYTQGKELIFRELPLNIVY
jgi:hypothetical protein